MTESERRFLLERLCRLQRVRRRLDERIEALKRAYAGDLNNPPEARERIQKPDWP